MADALSRMGQDVELSILSIPVWLEWDELKLEVGNDHILRAIICDLSAGVGKHVFTLWRMGGCHTKIMWLFHKIWIGCRS